MSDLNLNEVQEFHWNSNKKGWGDNNTAVAVLPRDSRGQPIIPAVVTIPELDPDDHGNLTVKNRDGSIVWCNIGSDAWEFSSNVTLDLAVGQISYTGNR